MTTIVKPFSNLCNQLIQKTQPKGSPTYQLSGLFSPPIELVLVLTFYIWAKNPSEHQHWFPWRGTYSSDPKSIRYYIHKHRTISGWLLVKTTSLCSMSCKSQCIAIGYLDSIHGGHITNHLYQATQKLDGGWTKDFLPCHCNDTFEWQPLSNPFQLASLSDPKDTTLGSPCIDSVWPIAPPIESMLPLTL